MKNSIDEKFKKDKLRFNLITNNNLMCKDCLYRYDDKDMPCNVSSCEVYQNMKPVTVLDGGNCDEYIKE